MLTCCWPRQGSRIALNVLLRLLPSRMSNLIFPLPIYQVAERGLVPGLKSSPALVSYIACAAAGSSNILFSRQSELREGAPICDDSGKVSKYERRKEAALLITRHLTHFSPSLYS